MKRNIDPIKKVSGRHRIIRGKNPFGLLREELFAAKDKRGGRLG